MQIVVNCRLLLTDRLEGIGWFTYQTLRRITRDHPDVHFVFLFDRPFGEEFIFADNVTPLVLSPPARHPLLYYIWFQGPVKSVLNKLRPDLFFSPDGFLSLGAKCKQLPVIHDINFHHHPRDSKWLTSKYYNHFFPRFAKEARRIATVSEFSKKDISQAYQIKPSEIDVVYNGINESFRPLDEKRKKETKEKYSDGKDFFVAVGSLHPRKNIENLVRAFSAFKKETHADLKLVLAGPGFWGLSSIQNVVDECGIREEIIFTGRLSNEDLALVLGSALGLTFVPYYEGFGIPLVEAMQAQVPIITSNVTSLPEIAGDTALLVNPGNISEIMSAMIRIYTNEKLRDDLITKGNLQKEKFSWDRTAELTWNSILKAVS